MFYENKYVEPKDRIFESEIIGPEGFAVDLLIGQAVRFSQDDGSKYYPLTDETKKNIPSKETLFKFLEKGYALGMKTYHDWDFFRCDMRKSVELYESRRADFPWLMFPEKARQHMLECISVLIKQYGNFEP